MTTSITIRNTSPSADHVATVHIREQANIGADRHVSSVDIAMGEEQQFTLYTGRYLVVDEAKRG
jgi:hypothetical protein